MDLLDFVMSTVFPLEGESEGKSIVCGIAGAPGSGKSTLTQDIQRVLKAQKRRCVIFSLDDYYVCRAERLKLAQGVHSLLGVRGVPGTHELPLLFEHVEAELEGRVYAKPKFDKLKDDRVGTTRVTGQRPEVILVEGWCLGVLVQPESSLVIARNTMEAEEDADCLWRRYVNEQIDGYEKYWNRFHSSVYLKSPSFETVVGWRLEQEKSNVMADAAAPSSGMDRNQVTRFLLHYQRIIEWMNQNAETFFTHVLALDFQRKLILPGK